MRVILAAVGTVALVSSAMAADLPVKASSPLPAAPVQTWTGFYAGGDVGGLWTRNGSGVWSPLDVIHYGVFPNVGTLQDNSVVGGVHAGYNWQFAPTWVAGIEADWSWTDAKSSFSQPWVRSDTGAVRPNTLATMSLSEDWIATVRGRIGYLVTPATLVYFTGGVAWSKFDYTGNSHNELITSATQLPFVAQSQFSATKPGYVLGGGLEYAFWGNWSVRAEYLYYHFNTAAAASPVSDSTGNFPQPVFFSGFHWNGDTKINVVRAGVSYKF